MANWLTFADIKERVSDLLDDSGLTDVIGDSINEAYRDMMNCDPAGVLWFRRKRGTFNLAASTRAYTDAEAVGGATAGALTSASITDLNKIISMSVGGYPCKAVPLDYLDANASALWDDTDKEPYPSLYLHERSQYTAVAVTGPPSGNRTRLYLNTINFFLMPSEVKAVRLTYEAGFNLLSADTDVPAMPAEFHHGLVSGAMVMMELFGKSDIAATWSAIYGTVKSSIIAANRRSFNRLEPVDPWVRL